MLKRVFTVISIILVISCMVLAVGGNSFDKKEVVYVYSPYCNACRMFDNLYMTLKTTHSNDAKFTEINADSSYGRHFVMKNNVYFIPHLVMINNNNKYVADAKCMFDVKCIEDMYVNVMK